MLVVKWFHFFLNIEHYMGNMDIVASQQEVDLPSPQEEDQEVIPPPPPVGSLPPE